MTEPKTEEERKKQEEDRQKEELRKRIAEDLGKESVDIDLDSLLDLIVFETVRSDNPKLLMDNDELVVSMFPNVPHSRGKYTARLNKDRLTIFKVKAETEEPLAVYAHADIRKAYDEIVGFLYPEGK